MVAIAEGASGLIDGGVNVDHVDAGQGDSWSCPHLGGNDTNQVASASRLPAGRGGGDLIKRLLPILAPIVLAYIGKQFAGEPNRRVHPGGRVGRRTGRRAGQHPRRAPAVAAAGTTRWAASGQRAGAASRAAAIGNILGGLLGGKKSDRPTYRSADRPAAHPFLESTGDHHS